MSLYDGAYYIGTRTLSAEMVQMSAFIRGFISISNAHLTGDLSEITIS